MPNTGSTCARRGDWRRPSAGSGSGPEPGSQREARSPGHACWPDGHASQGQGPHPCGRPGPGAAAGADAVEKLPEARADRAGPAGRQRSGPQIWCGPTGRWAFTTTARRWLFRQDASFTMQRGDRVAVLGPNGSGKTTLIRLLVGELDAHGGPPAPWRLSGVGYLAQELEGLDPRHTVLAERQRRKRRLPRDAGPAYAPCWRACSSRREGRSTSGWPYFGRRGCGWRWAKLLLAEPDLLVLDEPTNGLDLASGSGWRKPWGHSRVRWWWSSTTGTSSAGWARRSWLF